MPFGIMNLPCVVIGHVKITNIKTLGVLPVIFFKVNYIYNFKK